MEESVKSIIIAAAVVIACAIGTITFSLYRMSRGVTNTTEYAIGEMSSSADGYDIKALEDETLGVDLVAAMKRLNQKYNFSIVTKTSSSTITNNYNAGDSLSGISDQRSGKWINPTATFSCELVRDSKDVITGMLCTQISDYSGMADPIQDSAEFSSLKDVYTYASNLSTLADDFSGLFSDAAGMDSLFVVELPSVYDAYAKTVNNYYKSVAGKSLSADEQEDFKLLSMLVRDGNYYKLGNYVGYKNLVSSSSGWYRLIPAGKDLNTGYLYAGNDVDSSIVAGRYSLAEGAQLEFISKTSSFLMSQYTQSLTDLADLLYNTDGNSALVNSVGDVQNNLMAAINILNNLDKQNERYSRNLQQALTYLDTAKANMITLYREVQTLNDLTRSLKGSDGTPLSTVPAEITNLVNTVDSLYNRTFELGGDCYRLNKTYGAQCLNELYQSTNQYNNLYKKVTLYLSDSQTLSKSISSTLSMINKLIDVNSAIGGVSTDHDEADLVDKLIAEVEAAL